MSVRTQRSKIRGGITGKLRRQFLVVLVAALAVFLITPKTSTASDNTLAILAAGVQQSEDGPFVNTEYQFLPGDFVYFTFQVAGYRVKSNDQDESRKIALSWQVTPEDAKGVALTKADKGTVDTTLNPEDKHWTPKRRSTFLIPSFVAAGKFHIHVEVKDSIAGTEASADFPFQIGGIKISPSPTITIENFAFLRKQNDREALQVPAFSAGDTVFGRFYIVGFHYGPGNQYHVAYGLTVVRPDGKVFLDQPKAAQVQEADFYAAQFVPGNINVITPADSLKGEYVLTLTVHDLVSNESYETKQAFSIE
jgi:hypothetical protein